MGDLLVIGGSIIDGTGAPVRRGDVRVHGGVIVEVGERLEPAGEATIDATDAYVTPGLIDCHTHFDGEMFWDPSLDPLPLYGMTTAIMGNCGLGIAPIRPATHDAVADLMCFVEDLPFSLFETHVPWGWESWSQYHSIASRVPITATLFAYTAHNALRAFAMGADAWHRPATEAERASMAHMLADALRHGSLGLSTNFFDTDRAQLVPSRVADDAEFEALFDVLSQSPRASLQLIARDTADARRMCELAGPRGIRILRLTGSFEEHGADLIELIAAEGWDVWRMGGGNQPTTPRLGFDTSIGTAAVTAWHQMVNGPAERKLPLLRDPDWRSRARHDWDHPLREQNSFKDLASFILSESENGAGPVGLSLAALAQQRGLHPSDALADWVLANGLGSRYTRLQMGPDSEGREAMVRRNIDDPHAIMGGTDAGAHLRMFCGAGANSYLLTHWVKEKNVMSVERAVHGLTARIAECFSLNDRGVIAPGKRGDLAVFSLDEITLHDEVKVSDLPDGQWRYTRPSGGFRATVVAGTPTVLAGKATGAAPARIGDASTRRGPGLNAMTGKLEGKVALITGAGRGQGLAEARLFATEGANVVLTDVHYDDRASIEREFSETGLVGDLDVGDASQWQAIVEAAGTRFGGVDILINNAGIVAPSVTIIDLDLDLYERVIRVNQIGPLLGIKYVAPSIIARGGGAIVNISSVAGLGAIPGAAPYVSSKFATRGLTKVAAIELGPHNIRVNSIHPGGVDTPMLRQSESAKRVNYEPKNLPLGRIAQPEEVARLALFLACDDSSYCTGSEFVIDGGQTCALGTP